MKENSISYERAKQETEKLIAEIEKNTITHRAFTAECLRRILKENEELKEYIVVAPNLDEMTAIKYKNIQEEAYIKGRAEEQQRTEQIIYEDYISKQKLKDILEQRLYKYQEADDGEYKQEYLTRGELELVDRYKECSELYKLLFEEDVYKLEFDYVPIQKIKDKIEKLQREFDFYAGREHAEWQDGEFDGEQCDDISLQIKILKELLKEEYKK